MYDLIKKTGFCFHSAVWSFIGVLGCLPLAKKSWLRHQTCIKRPSTRKSVLRKKKVETVSFHFCISVPSRFVRVLLPLPSIRPTSVSFVTLSLSKVLLNSLNHLVAHARGFREARSKVSLYLFKLAAVAVHVAERDTFGPVLFG